jgi:putative transposase
MEPSKVVKEYKEELAQVNQENEMLTKIVGKMTVEKEWLEKKLVSLDLSDRKEMIESELKTLSISKQCDLLQVSRSGLYYIPVKNPNKLAIKEEIKDIYKDLSIYGSNKVHQQLLENGFKVSVNTVASYRQELGLKAILAVKPIKTTVAIKEQKKYSYKLRGLDINHVNQVWSTDLTYIKTSYGMVYLAAIIDWYSKAVLSYKISNTMDTDIVMSVLNEALASYGPPEIFNTDQGSQYTSEVHTQRLKNKGVTISMDGKGRATDNICIERFWRSAKCECIYLNEYHRISQLQKDVAEYIDFYNNRRFHQTLDYKKPMDVYQAGIQFTEIEKRAA